MAPPTFPIQISIDCPSIIVMCGCHGIARAKWQTIFDHLARMSSICFHDIQIHHKESQGMSFEKVMNSRTSDENRLWPAARPLQCILDIVQLL